MKRAIASVMLVLFFLVILNGVFAEEWSKVHQDYYQNASWYMADGINSSDLGINLASVSNSDSVSLGGWLPVSSPAYSSEHTSVGSLAIKIESAERIRIDMKNNVSFTGLIQFSVYLNNLDNENFNAYIHRGDIGSETYDNKFDMSGGVIRCGGYLSTNDSFDYYGSKSVSAGEWFNLTLAYNESDYVSHFVNGELCWRRANHHELGYIDIYSANPGETFYIDDFWISDNAPRPTAEPDLIPPGVININCTSCNIPDGDTDPPYETYDTTPTFSLNTTEDALCRISDQNLNYSNMSTDSNCTGEGIFHVCTLPISDELWLTPTDYVYIACKDDSDNSNTTSLEVSITQVQYNASKAIEKGIVISIPSATIYSDQKVYVRNIDDNQALATFDKVALYGSQRWAFNYIGTNESSIGDFYNLTPVFYFLEMFNISSFDIIGQVSSLINATKT